MKNWSHILAFKFFFLFLFLCFFSRIFLLSCFPPHSQYQESDREFTGRIVSFKVEEAFLSLKVKNKETVIAYYYFKNEIEKETYAKILKIDQTLHLKGKFDTPNKASIFNTFDYRGYLQQQNIFYVLKVDSLEILDPPRFIYQIKNRLLSYLKGFSSSSYYQAFLFGDTSTLDKDSLNQNGIGHLFAVSGMHVSFFLTLYERLFKRKSKVSSCLLGLFLLFYAFLTNFTVSIIRVIGVYYLYQLSEKYNLGLERRTCLILVGLLLLIYQPYFLYQVSFLFSFGISFSLSFLRPSSHYILSLLKSSFVSLLASLPIMGLYFYEINLCSFFFNLLFIPLVTFLLFPLCFLSVVLPFLNPLFSLVIQIFETLNTFCSHITFGLIVIPKMPLWYAVFLFGLILLMLSSKERQKLFLTLIMTALILLKLSVYLDSSLSVYYLDVGQGDATFLLTPHHKEAILIDTGGKVGSKKSYLSTNLVRFMHSLGVSKINYLIITHGDYDHMGEAINLVDNFKVEKVIFNCGEFNELEKELIKVLDKKKIKYYSCLKKLNIDNNKLFFLQTKLYDNENDNSNVIYTELDGYKFMFMGDAGVEKEKDILNKYNISGIDVLKIGHHGSKTSSSKEFINEINPKYSIISVGKNNRYGHPNKEVLNNLDQSKIYRTDQDGSILFKIKNNKLKVETLSS